jgi:DNA-directed RNA polymerase specialized sigma24 family protein
MEVESRYVRSLLQSAQAGNNAALEQLLEMNLDRIYTISHRLTGNQQDARMLASKTLVEAWKQLDKIRTDVPFNLWLNSLNVHLGLQNLREVKEEKKKRSFFKKKKIEIKEPDSKVSELDAEICKLPKLERTVFVLNKIENYSPDELSGMMKISSKQIREEILSAENILISKAFIQTREMLTKKIKDLPKKIKAEIKILKDALTEIYEIKLEDRVEEEVEEEREAVEDHKEEYDEKTKPVKPKLEELKVKKEIGIEVPSITPAFKKKLSWILTIIAIGIAAYVIITSGLEDWEVSLQSGTVTIEGEILSGISAFSAEEVLTTDKNSTAQVIVPNVGKISVEEQTEFTRLDQKNSAELIKGKIKVDCSSAEEFFILQIPVSLVSNYYLGAIYNVDVYTDKSGQIFVNSGWIIVKNKEKEIVAASNYFVDFDAAYGLSVPYHKNSNLDLINAVRDFLNTKSEMHVERIASLATSTDALTLWNLLKIVSPAKRLLIYSKLNVLVPHPSAITNDDVINLNQEKLQIWLEEIERNI